MFGISLTEIVVIATIALVVVGPQKLPTMLRTLGQWVRKLRKITTEVRAQTGIDDILREEGIDGVHELRSLLRGEIRGARQRGRPADDPYPKSADFDSGREYPSEGVDVYHAVPDDLWQQEEANAAVEANTPVDEKEDAGSVKTAKPDEPTKTAAPTPPPSSPITVKANPVPRPSKTS